MVCVVVLSQTAVLAQPYAIGASVSQPQPSPGEEITITLSISEALDFYFGAVEVTYPTDVLEFLSLEHTGLSAGGLSTSGMVSPGVVGVSVTRTSPLESPSSGELMAMRFRVLSTAYAGSAGLSFGGAEMFDSRGSSLEVTAPGDLVVEVTEAIGDAGLLVPPDTSVTEGGTCHVTARLFAAGVTDTGRLHMWAGVSPDNSDPTSWDASAWMPMDFTQADGSDYLYYTCDAAYRRPVGTWYMAVRCRLDDGSFIYGGVDGLWDATDHPSAILHVTQRAPYRYTLAEWNFEGQTRYPASATAVNQDALMGVTGASFEGFSSGASGEAANANGWNEGGDGSKYWSAAVSTEGFIDLQLSSAQYGSGTGPRDFRLETSTDGSTWTGVSGATIRVETNWSSGVLDTLALPAQLNDQPSVGVRWVMTSDSCINGGDVVSSTGTNRLDEVLLTGINPNPQRVMVYPGDANNDSVVNADDVLALGRWWMSRGPTPVYNSLAFEAREVEAWIPEEATYADGRGEGRVDHGDLMPIGLHFGQSVEAAKKHTQQTPLAQMVIDPQKAGSTIALRLASALNHNIRGVAFSLSVSGASPGQWEMHQADPVFCPAEKQNKLLGFDIKKGNLFEAAYVLKGSRPTMRADELVRLEIKALEDWTGPVTVAVNRLTLSKADGEHPAGDILLLPTGSLPVQDDPDSPMLSVRPNPFSSTAIISYGVPRKTNVRIEVLDIQGKRVATPVERIHPPGRYEVAFNGYRLAPGVYLCHMSAGNKDATVKFIKQ